MSVNSPHNAPDLLRTFGVLMLMDVVTHAFGLRRSLLLANRLGGVAVDDLANFTLVEAVAQKVATAAAFYPRRALCLEQSLALFVLLRRRGVSAELKFGVQTLPFSAHAWIEVEGRPVNERQGVVERLVAFNQVGV